MAVSDVAIVNLGLQKLGEGNITSLTQDDPRARAANAVYTLVRDRELRAHPWTFAKTRAVLAPSVTAPAFDYLYAFPLPTDCLRLLPPNRNGLDWLVERHLSRKAILTNDGDTLQISYIAQVTDPTEFDSLFVDAFAAKLAWQLCEKITQSNTKKADVLLEYKDALAAAKKANAFETISDETPEDPWLAARR